jgi:hypothetical protein
MSSRFASLRFVARGLAAIGTCGVIASCVDVSSAVHPRTPSSIIIIGGHPIVLNAQLRAVGNPDIRPATAVVGHLQLKLYETDEGVVASWLARITNTECESASAFGGGIYAIQDSEDFPSPLTVALLYLLQPERALGCGDNFIEGSTDVPPELASRLIGNPDEFTAVFFLTNGGVVAGKFDAPASSGELAR